MKPNTLEILEQETRAALAGAMAGAENAAKMCNLFSEAIGAIKAGPKQADQVRAHVRAELDKLQAEPLSERLQARLFNAANPPPEPATVFSIGHTAVCTAGNITTISAQAKNGKSAVIDSMIAATFAGERADCLGFKSSNPKGLAVVAIDTEQSPYDHHRLVLRSIARAGADSKPEWLLSYCLTGFKPQEVRTSFRVLLQLAAQRFGGVLALLIDGVADAARDVNDPDEANSIVAELHGLAIEFNCSIIGVIHLNPGSDFKTRGHLGSQLERKAETNLKLEKDTDETVTVYANKNRRAPISKATGPRFAWDHAAGMHLSIESRQISRQETEKQVLMIEADAMFHAAGKSVLPYGQALTLLMREVQASKSTAKRRLAQMIQMRILRKELTGLYALNL